MKKTLLLALSILFLFSFNACKDDDSDNPLTYDETISYLSKRWMFAESVGFRSFQFDKEGNYVIERVVAASGELKSKSANSINVELLSGTYTLAQDLKTITLSDFNEKITITSLTSTTISFSFKAVIFSSNETGEKLPLPEPSPTKFYAFCYDDNINELAEINIETGALKWTGYEYPGYYGNGRGYVFNGSDYFVMFGAGATGEADWVIVRGSLSGQDAVKVEIEDIRNPKNFDNIILHKGKYYAFCYDDDINELAEINIETGALTWTGYKISDYPSNSRGYVFTDMDEFITFGEKATKLSGGDYKYDWVITKGNLTDKVVKQTIVEPSRSADNFEDIIMHNGKFYTFCYDEGINELAEINIETGDLTWTGYKIPNYSWNARGYVFNGDEELVTFGAGNQGEADWVLNKVSLSNKTVTKVDITDSRNPKNFSNIVSNK